MSDIEEPAAKISKLETSSQPGTEEELDEGQEEWLSEGILTDDDGNNMHEERLDNTASHDSTVSSTDAYQAQDEVQQNHTDIEQALDDMENANRTEQQEIDTFLVRKSADVKEESELDESVKQSDDDGHDTDELLRMLGEDDQNGKIKVVKKKLETMKKEESSDDDEHIFHGANVRQLKVAKNVLMKKTALKAEPEDMSDGDSFMSSDEATTVKKIFGMKRHSNVAAKSTTKSGVIRPTITVTKKVVTVDRKGDKAELKSIKQEEPQTHVKTEDVESFYEEFLDEDFDEESVLEAMKEDSQDIMKPEMMDEEIPSDCDSNSDEDSLYDEFPSSDSDDMEEWFTLDIRDERAGDYLPLLGSKAHKLLTEEKEKVAARIANLKESLSALTHSGKQQAEQLRKATATLAELDATLKAS